MSQKIAEELLPRLRLRSTGRGRKGRSLLIDELCEQWGYSLKHAIKLLGAKTVGAATPPCAKGVSPNTTSRWRRCCGGFGRLGKDLRSRVLSISAAQIDRLLAARKTRVGHRGRCGTKPGGLLKTQIPIRTDNWDIARPGYLEADTVAHCGGSLEGDFVWRVTYCDIYSGWTANLAVWNKGSAGVVAATREVAAALPFELLSFDTDKGSDFLNWRLLRYFQERPKRLGSPVRGLTRKTTTATWSRRTGRM